MKLVSSINEINYGAYDESLDWNIQNYQVYNNGKIISGKNAQGLLSHCLRINIFTSEIQSEIEFLKNSDTLRIFLVGYDIAHDLCLEKTWLLTKKQFAWNDNPERYHISGKSLGLDLDISCGGEGSIHFHFSYFDHYQIQFLGHIHRTDRKPLRNVNPFDLDTWRFSEKHAMLDSTELILTLDGSDYSPATSRKKTGTQPENFNLSYEWFGGYLPVETKELRCQFWQLGTGNQDGESLSNPLQPRGSEPISDVELQGSSLKEQMSSQNVPVNLLQMAGALTIMGCDGCSSESAIWVGQGIRYRLPRIIPSFARSEQSSAKKGNLIPDLEWSITAGNHLNLRFQPFNISDAPKLVFPQTQTQRLYGVFYGKLLDQFGYPMSVRKALGFIDYRVIQWRKR